MFLSRASNFNHEKSYHHYRVCPHRTVRKSSDPDHAFCTVPGDLPLDLDGESDDDPGDQK